MVQKAVVCQQQVEILELAAVQQITASIHVLSGTFLSSVVASVGRLALLCI